MKNKLIKNTIALVVSNVIVRLIGLVFKVWLAKTILPEALGYYQLSLSVYSLFIALSSSGLPNAMSKHYAACSTDRESAGAVLYSGVKLGLVISFISAAVMGLLAPLLSWLVLKDLGSYTVFLALIPAVLFGGAAAAPSGYFHAASKSTVIAISELVEQIAKVLFVIALFSFITIASAEAQATAATAGIGIGGIVSYIMIRFFLGKVPKIRDKHIHRQLVKTATPLTANRFITSFLNMITASLIPIRLVASGLTTSDAFAGYGIINGMAMPIIMLPCTVVSALCVTLLPRLSKGVAEGDFKGVKRKVKLALSADILICVLTSVVLAIFSGFLGDVLYKNSMAGSFIGLLSPCCIFVGINQLCGTCLTALGHEYKTFKIHITVSAVSLAASFLLSGLFGLTGYAFAIMIQGAVGSILFLTVLSKCLKKRLSK